MSLKEKYAAFNQIAPIETVSVLGHPFAYRFYKNPDPKKNVTLLLLAGSSGLADGFSYLFDYFMPEYNIISFNYPMDFRDNNSLADAIAEFIRIIKAENVSLMGQSYGGLIAQIIAKRHRDAVKGMILSGTCGLGKGVYADGIAVFEKMLAPKKIERNLRMDNILHLKSEF